jgi:DNA-binding transcriptional regulator GbsR (MarR family)
MSDLLSIQNKFINHWGTLGSSWGVNRTMTQIHALLMVSTEPITTDAVMERLQISRGNAHSNLKELVAWGIARLEIVSGERKDCYVADQDPWKLLCTVARERKRREIEPALDALAECLNEASPLKDKEAKAFKKQLSELQEFLEMADRIFSKLGRSEKSRVMKLLAALI